MKLVIAIIRSERLEAVQTALNPREGCLISISQVISDGSDPGSTGMHRGTAFHVRRPRLRLELAVKDQFVDTAIEAIVRAAYTPESIHTGEVMVVAYALDACVLSVLTEEAALPSCQEREVPLMR